MAGEAYADNFNDFNPDGIFGNHKPTAKASANMTTLQNVR
jgi:hypothetical protein